MRTWLKTWGFEGRAQARDAYAVAALIGVAIALWVFGFGFIAGTNAFWSYPVGDAGMQLTAYRYFVVDAWHWPILKTTLVGAPSGINILQCDAIPIVALVGKLWFGITGRVVNLYGLWMVACYVLQGVFATRLARAMGERSMVGAALSSIVALTAPAFLLRFYHHGLCGQFIVLWALALYFELGRAWPGNVRAARSILVLLGVGLLCHPYFTAMVFPICIAAIARGAMSRDSRQNVERLIVFVVVVVGLGLIGVTTGHLSGAVMGTQGFDFGKSSLNLLSPFVPLPNHSSVWTNVPPTLAEGTGLQWDGAFFLGFGVLSLIAFQIATARRVLWASIRAHSLLLGTLLLLTMYAVSNRVYLSSSLVFSYRIPEILDWITSQFRSTGRMFWPVGYFVLVATIVFTLRQKRRLGVGLAIACAFVHLLDSQRCAAVVRDNTRSPWSTELDWEEWRTAIRAHSEVIQIPSYACASVFAQTRWGFEAREVQWLAAEEGKPINGIRMARGMSNSYCDRELANYRTLEVERDDALILYPRISAPLASYCFPVGAFQACSKKLKNDPTLLAKTRLDEAPLYVRETPIDFTPDNPKNGILFLDADWPWAFYEGPRIWTAEKRAHIRLRVNEPVTELELNLEAMLAKDHPTATLHLFVNDEELDPLIFTSTDNDSAKPRPMKLPHPLRGIVRVGLDVETPIIPWQHGQPGPPSAVGVALHRFLLR